MKTKHTTHSEQELRDEIAKLYVDDMLTWGHEDDEYLGEETIFEERMGIGAYKVVVEVYTDAIMHIIQSEREKVVDLIRWELSDVLIKERETHGHINLAKYIKRLAKLEQKEEKL